MLSFFRLYNIQFKEVKILWGPGTVGCGSRSEYEGGGRCPDNPPINSAKPCNEVSKSTNCPLITKHNDLIYHIFLLHRISFTPVSTGGLCPYQLL